MGQPSAIRMSGPRVGSAGTRAGRSRHCHLFHDGSLPPTGPLLWGSPCEGLIWTESPRATLLGAGRAELTLPPSFTPFHVRSFPSLYFPAISCAGQMGTALVSLCFQRCPVFEDRAKARIRQSGGVILSPANTHCLTRGIF